MLAALFNLINPLGGIAKQLTDAYLKAKDAQTEQQKIEAEILIEQLKARRDALLQGEMSWLSKVVQALWAAPFIIFAWKVIVWDKVLGWGVTDPIAAFEQNLGMMIAGFYFLGAVGPGIIRRVRGR